MTRSGTPAFSLSGIFHPQLFRWCSTADLFHSSNETGLVWLAQEPALLIYQRTRRTDAALAKARNSGVFKIKSLQWESRPFAELRLAVWITVSRLPIDDLLDQGKTCGLLPSHLTDAPLDMPRRTLILLQLLLPLFYAVSLSLIKSSTFFWCLLILLNIFPSTRFEHFLERHDCNTIWA